VKRRFLGKILSNIFILAGVVLLASSLGPFVVDEAWYLLKEIKNQKYTVSPEPKEVVIPDSVFARFLSTKDVKIEPINRDFSLVIEKIGLNAPIVANVAVGDQVAYVKALQSGIAHASVSAYPSKESGNVYLFAHASLNFWQLGKYASVFNLLRKLEAGDRIYIFYNGAKYVYEVVNKETMQGWDMFPLQRPVLEPILTLQTCDPPGTTLNRLVVTAKLLEVTSN
jgi:LPXTG-site transpeptidase (sortase) family protein